MNKEIILNHLDCVKPLTENDKKRIRDLLLLIKNKLKKKSSEDILVEDYSEVLYTTTDEFDFESTNKLIANLKKQAEAFFARNNITEDRQKIEVYMEAHYPFQVYELSVDITDFLSDDYEITEESIAKMEKAFHKEHKRTFSIEDDTYIECVSWRVKAIGKHEREAELPEKEIGSKPDLADEIAKNSGTRKVYFKKYKDIKVVPVFRGQDLVYGDVVHGPAIIEEPTTTIVVLPDYDAKVTKFNNYCVEKA